MESPSPQDYLKRSLNCAIVPAINEADVDWLRAVVAMGAEIDVKKDHIGKLMDKCSDVFYYDPRNHCAEQQICHIKYIRMMDYLLDAGCTLPRLLHKHFMCAGQYGIFRIVEFLLRQGAEVEEKLLKLTFHMYVISLKTEILRRMLHLIPYTNKNFAVTRLGMGKCRDSNLLKLLLCAECPVDNVLVSSGYFKQIGKKRHWKLVEYTFALDMIVEAYFI